MTLKELYNKADYKDELGMMFNGDCLELMKDIPDKSIDMIITDPPYLHVKGGCKCKRVNVGKYSKESFINKEMSDFGREKIREFLNLSKLKLKKMNMYIFCSKLQLPFYFEWITENKYNFDLLIWNKISQSFKSSKHFSADIEYIIRINQSGVSLNKIINEERDCCNAEYYKKIQTFKREKGSHETIKPIELIKRYIELSSNKDDVILDMFMGSGTTAVACKNLNRRYIGIEIDKEYFDIAVNRLGETK